MKDVLGIHFAEGIHRLRMPMKLALAVRETVLGVGWAPCRGGGGGTYSPSNASLG